jgi:Tfp pilus assembly protein PilX
VVAEFIGQSEIGQVADERRKLRGRIWQVTLGALAVIALLGVGLAFSVADASRARTAEAEQKTLAAIADAAKARAEAETLKADIAAFQAVSREAAGPVATATTTVETEPSLAEAAPSAPAPGRAPASAEPATVSASAARLVAELNAADRSKRLAAGQAVAGLVRSDAPDAVIAELVKELEPPRLQALSAPGRFNVLYTLNLADGARLRAAGGQRLSEALAQIATRAEAGIAIGDQTGDCINSLDEKLAGRPGVAACGGR